MVCALLAVTAACDKMPLTAPAGTVITLVSTTNVLPVNGSTDVVAVLIENGTTGTGAGAAPAAGTPVHNGTVVTFTTSLGRIEPAEARTNNGRVTVALIADGRSGTATISAFSGAATKTLEIKIGAAAAERVSITASPTSVPANGGTSTISARVEDISGNPLFGVPVAFSTTAGNLSAGSALTNENGVATVTISTTLAATVTASAGGKTSTAAITVRSRSSITLTPPAGSVFVGAPASFTVTPGTTVALTGVTITFGDGTSQNLGAISSATTVVHFYGSDGVFQVAVRGTDVDGGTAEASGGVAVTPFSFNVSASPTTGLLGTVFSFTVSGIPTTVPIDRYEWNLGDGTIRQTDTGSTTHEYLQRGTKTITVTVVPRYGPSKSATFQVSVT
jgi:adhesin/invasin